MNLYIPVLSLKHHGGIKVICEIVDYIYQTESSEIKPVLLCPRGLNNTSFLKNSLAVKEIGYDFKLKFINQLSFIFLVFLYLSRNKGVYLANYFVTWYPSYIASKLNRSRLIYFIQGQDDSYEGFIGKILNKLCQITFLDKNQDFLPANEYLLNLLSERYGIYSVIPDFNVGLQDDFFITKKFIRAEKEYDFCFFGRSEPWKRIDRFYDLIEMINVKKTVSNILFISKDKKAIDETKKKSASLRYVNITYVESNSNKELCEYLRKCEYFVGTSEREGFYLPPLEAMSQGVYPILYDCGGPSVYIKSKLNGSFVTNSSEIYEIIFSKMKNNQDIKYLLDQSCKFKSSISYQGLYKYISK